jgi:hypothetical protein
MKEFFEFIKMFPSVRWELHYNPIAGSMEIMASKYVAGEIYRSRLQITNELIESHYTGAAVYHHILTQIYNKLPN